jgi:hypothetical protein
MIDIKGFDEHGNRREAFNTRTFNQFQVSERKFKERFLKEDKAGQNKSLADQNSRAIHLDNLEASLNDSYDMWSKGLYSKGMTDDERHILNEVHSQKNTAIKVDEETQEPVMYIPKRGYSGQALVNQKGDLMTGDEIIDYDQIIETGKRKKRYGAGSIRVGDINNTQRVTTRDINKIMETNRTPSKVKLTCSNNISNAYKAGVNNDVFSYERRLASNKTLLNEFCGENQECVRALYYNDVVGDGSTFAEEIKYHPHFRDISYKDIERELEKEKDTPSSIAEQAATQAKESIRKYRDKKVSEKDKDMMVKHMLQNNPEAAIDYLGRYMTDIEKNSFEQGMRKNNNAESTDMNMG